MRDLETLASEYDILVSTEVDYNESHTKNYLKDAVGKKCRFCNKGFPEVKFNSVAHAIPEFTGNKSLIATFECDNCNQYFSKFENEFANFMLPYNALGGVKKKGNKFPKYKQDIIVYHPIENYIHIDNFPQELHPDTNGFDLILDTPSYIPNFIYRSLIKIGLTLIPENTIGKYQDVLTWLMDMSSDTIFPASMFFSIFPFRNPSSKIRCVLFTRKESINREIPRTLLVLSYQNFSFQTFFPVPFSENKGKLIPFPVAIPTSLDLNLNLAQEVAHKLIDLSKIERIKGEKAQFNIKSLD
ncbi:HNH endonuclease [Pontibacter qinzhouensis]|uniref:HNH endonuclease n=1 Tax=Pontibacter qinzhouensis TaxID=2603253 RepID=UPI00164FBA0B|nr:HNH endonuclease [Pontibacter qinzhouensis]